MAELPPAPSPFSSPTSKAVPRSGSGIGPPMRAAVDRQLAILQSLDRRPPRGPLQDHRRWHPGGLCDRGRRAAGRSSPANARSWPRTGASSDRCGCAWRCTPGRPSPDARGDYLAAPLNRLVAAPVDRPWRPDPPLADGPATDPRRAARRERAARPRRAPAAGSAGAGAGLPAAASDLPAEFPPLKSLESRPNNLPLQPTPFLGREQEVEQVVDAPAPRRGALPDADRSRRHGQDAAGAPGRGRAAGRLRRRVFFVPLAPLTDPALVPPTIATTLGMREEGGQPLRERLQDFLADEAAAAGAGQLRAPGGGGSRGRRAPGRLPRAEGAGHQPDAAAPAGRAGVPGAAARPAAPQAATHRWSSSPSTRPCASSSSGPKRSSPTSPSTTRTPRRWPRSAGGWTGCRWPSSWPRRGCGCCRRRRCWRAWSSGCRLLTGGARDAPAAAAHPARHHRLELRPAAAGGAAALFRRLAVFAGGCTLEAAEAVANPDGRLDVFGGLERLVEQSLLRQEAGPEGEPRFTMLETIREFGLEQLEASGEAEEIRRDHTTYFLALAEEAHAELRAGASTVAGPAGDGARQPADGADLAAG